MSNEYDAYDIGWDDYVKSSYDNPYDVGTEDHLLYDEGYDDAKEYMTCPQSSLS